MNLISVTALPIISRKEGRNTPTTCFEKTWGNIQTAETWLIQLCGSGSRVIFTFHTFHGFYGQCELMDRSMKPHIFVVAVTNIVVILDGYYNK